ncbi:hypothetical protein BC829DRAFT_416766 [Chytridium lagenaria]|nr:hypothetical protein BC829DRAFT_416766 [Chytridium lagenaria]
MIRRIFSVALFLLLSAHAVVSQLELKIDVKANNGQLSCWAFHTLGAGGNNLVLTKTTDPKINAENRKLSPCNVSKAAAIIPGIKFDPMRTCGENAPGFQCDEFPPASSLEAGTVSAGEMSSMCMPGPSNMAAGGMLSHIPNGATFKYVLSVDDPLALFKLCWDYMIFVGTFPVAARPSSLPPYVERKTKSGRVSKSYTGLLRAEAAEWASEFVDELREDGIDVDDIAAEEAVARSRVAAPAVRKAAVAKGGAAVKGGAAPADAAGVKGQGPAVDIKAFMSKMSAKFGKLRAKIQQITAKLAAGVKNAAKAVGNGLSKMVGAARGAVSKVVPAARGRRV